jgi:hypothetical protein
MRYCLRIQSWGVVDLSETFPSSSYMLIHLIFMNHRLMRWVLFVSPFYGGRWRDTECKKHAKIAELTEPQNPSLATKPAHSWEKRSVCMKKLNKTFIELCDSLFVIVTNTWANQIRWEKIYFGSGFQSCQVHSWLVPLLWAEHHGARSWGWRRLIIL